MRPFCQEIFDYCINVGFPVDSEIGQRMADPFFCREAAYRFSSTAATAFPKYPWSLLRTVLVAFLLAFVNTCTAIKPSINDGAVSLLGVTADPRNAISKSGNFTPTSGVACSITCSEFQSAVTILYLRARVVQGLSVANSIGSFGAGSQYLTDVKIVPILPRESN